MRPNQINIHKKCESKSNDWLWNNKCIFYHSLYPLSLKGIWNSVMRRGIRRTHHITRLSIRNTEKRGGAGEQSFRFGKNYVYSRSAGGQTPGRSLMFYYYIFNDNPVKLQSGFWRKEERWRESETWVAKVLLMMYTLELTAGKAVRKPLEFRWKTVKRPQALSSRLLLIRRDFIWQIYLRR